jgi:hypothetical protein
VKVIKLTFAFFALLIVCAWGVRDVIALECSNPTLPIASDAVLTSDIKVAFQKAKKPQTTFPFLV